MIKINRSSRLYLLGGADFFYGRDRVDRGLCTAGRRGENERSLEKRIEGVERWFLRKNEVLLKVKKKGKNWFFRGKKKVQQRNTQWCFIREL